MLSIRNQRVRSARRLEPRRRQGPGPCAGIHGRQRGPAQPADQARVKGTLPGPVLPDHLRADRDRRAFTTRRASPTRCPRRSRATSLPRSSSASCRRPRAARRPARISLYGHGLLGSRDEVEAGNVQAMATEHNMVFCATDWWGLADGDTPFDITALQNLNHFPAVVDRLQQGVLNTLFLGRLMLNPQGLAANAGVPDGGADARHLAAVLRRQQPGRDHGRDDHRGGAGLPPRRAGRHRDRLRRTCSSSAAPTSRRSAQLLFASYTDKSMSPVILDLMQQLWDRGDPDGYAQQMTSKPLPGHPVAHGADAGRLRRSPGQHVLGRDRGPDDRRVGARAGARPQHRPLP